MLSNFILTYNFDSALQVRLPMKCYSYLSETPFSNYPAYFISELNIYDFFKALKIFEIKNVEELFIRGHFEIDRLKLSDVIHSRMLMKSGELPQEVVLLYLGN